MRPAIKSLLAIYQLNSFSQIIWSYLVQKDLTVEFSLCTLGKNAELKPGYMALKWN